MICLILPLLIGFGIDCVLGDPHRLPHPVVRIGKTISALECVLRRIFPKTPRGERAAGAGQVELADARGDAAADVRLLWRGNGARRSAHALESRHKIERLRAGAENRQNHIHNAPPSLRREGKISPLRHILQYMKCGGLLPSVCGR